MGNSENQWQVGKFTGVRASGKASRERSGPRNFGERPETALGRVGTLLEDLAFVLNVNPPENIHFGSNINYSTP